MKRFALCLAAFLAGFTSGASVRYAAVSARSYQRGFLAGTDACHREAVRSGHGRYAFTRSTDPITFEWLPSLPDYHPENMQSIDGALDNPDRPSSKE